MAKINAEVAERLRRAQKSGGKILYLAGCGLRAVPEEVFALADLEVIDLSDNKLTAVPERLRNLRKLRRVLLFDNPIERLPDLRGLHIDGDAYIRCRAQIDKKNIAGLWINSRE